MGRPPTTAHNETPAVPSLCVLVPHTLLRGLDPNLTVIRSINGFNSRCLHVMTGEHYRETATAPAYDLVLAVPRRCLCYIGYVLRMPADRMVRSPLITLVIGPSYYPTGSLFNDCHRAATTCGNGVESFNVTPQSSFSILN